MSARNMVEIEDATLTFGFAVAAWSLAHQNFEMPARRIDR